MSSFFGATRRRCKEQSDGIANGSERQPDLVRIK